MNFKKIEKLTGLAINDYNMIDNNDRIVVAVSGGIDSLTLLMTLFNRLKFIPIKYDLYPVFINITYNPNYYDSILKLKDFISKNYCLNLEIINFNLEEHIEKKNKRKKLCSECRYIRRIKLIEYAINNNCNKIALGHNKDDIVETILMNLFINRDLSAMLPKLKIFDGKLTIIRPLSYLTKKQINSLRNIFNDVILDTYCPLKTINKDQQRDKIRNTIEQLSKDYPNVKDNIFAAFRNPKYDYLLNVYYEPINPKNKNRP